MTNNSKFKEHKSSLISIIIFFAVILINLIVYPMSLTDDAMTSGIGWFFCILLPSIPAMMASIGLAVVSIVDSIRSHKLNTLISKFLFILNILQIIFAISILVWFFN